MRENLNKLRGEKKADTLFDRIPRKKYAGAIADWSFYGTKNFPDMTDFRGSLGLGSVLAGGETNIYLNYHNTEKFNEKEQFYSWGYVDNDNLNLRQVIVGKIFTSSISSISSPIIGAQFTNNPTTYRRAYDGYQYSGYTEPNWMVELYVNDQLVNYKKADPTGFYQFNVPLVNGASVVRFKFYGPLGEEITHEVHIQIPFTFLPVGEFEYTASGGIIEDSIHTKFTRFIGNYGLNSSTTLGGGIEYLSSTHPAAIPFFNVSARIRPGLLMGLEYDNGVRTKALISLQLPSNLQVEATYTHYIPGQTAINVNYHEDRRISVSIPHSFSRFSLFTRLSVEQFILPTFQFTNLEWMLSITGRKISGNIITYGLLNSGFLPYYYSNFTLAYRLPAGFVFTPQAQYEYMKKDFISYRADLEKRFARNSYINLTYERNLKIGYNNIMVGLRYEFGFGFFGTNARKTSGINALDQYGSGSVIFEKNKDPFFNNRTNIGKGGVRILSFLDLNGNGIHDQGEPKITGLEISINAGRMVYDPKDTSLMVYQLEPYQKYFIGLNSDKFQNIDWILPYHSISVYIEPNQIRLIELPVSVKSEAGGKVYSSVKGVLKGQERILVCYLNSKNQVIARTLTEADGSYTYFGLKPGRYRVQLDPDQSKRLKMRSKPESIPFVIYPKKDGMFIDSLNLILENPLPAKNEVPKIWFQKDSSHNFIHPNRIPRNKIKFRKNRVGGRVPFTEDHMAVQMVCFGNLFHAIAEKARLGKALNKTVELIQEGEYYKLRVIGVEDEMEGSKIKFRLNDLGYYSILIYVP